MHRARIDEFVAFPWKFVRRRIARVDAADAVEKLNWTTSLLGQKAKYSLGVDVFRFAPESGLKSDIAPCPKGAKSGSRSACVFQTRHVTP
jgi:hypothetical protein